MSNRILLLGSAVVCGLAFLAPAAEAYQITAFASSNNCLPPAGTDVGPNPASLSINSGAVSGSVAVSGSQCSGPNAPFVLSGSAAASGNLQDATVTSASTGSAALYAGSIFTGTGSSQAVISDALTLGFAGPSTQVVIAAVFGGQTSFLADDPASVIDNTYQVSVNTGTHTGSFSHSANTQTAGGVGALDNSATFDGAAWPGATISNAGADSVTFSAPLTVLASDPTLLLSEFIASDASGATANFTGQIQLFLASGTTVTSTSGVFPTSSIPSVPEPITLSLLAPALLGLGATRLRRR